MPSSTRLADVPHSLRLSLTWDQGSELAQHRKIASELGLEVYCCDLHSPWRRGTNENTNGLLRQYMPKGTDLSLLTGADPGAIANQRGDRPPAKHSTGTHPSSDLSCYSGHNTCYNHPKNLPNLDSGGGVKSLPLAVNAYALYRRRDYREILHEGWILVCVPHSACSGSSR